MRCNVCGYEDNKNFSICPYCGETTVAVYSNINSNNLEITQNKNLNVKNTVPVIGNLPTSQPKGFVRILNGFKIVHRVDDGDFYRRYFGVNILAILCFIVLFISLYTNKNFDIIIDMIFVGILIFFSISSLLNHIYSSFMNNFTFEVLPNGISVKSPMKQYFISRSNLNKCWFEYVSKNVDTFNYSSFFLSLIFRGRYGRMFRESAEYYRNSDMFHNKKEGRSSYNIFIDVENPIFENDFLTPEDKKCLRFINTGISFQSASEARFVEQELKRTLNLPDLPVEGEYDYNKKMGIAKK